MGSSLPILCVVMLCARVVGVGLSRGDLDAVREYENSGGGGKLLSPGQGSSVEA